MNLESIDLLRPKAVQAFVNNNPYLDILETAFLLRLPPCQIRWLAEIGLIPAHALKHGGQTCWKFRLDELLSWAVEIGVEVSHKAVHDLLSLGNRAH